MIFDSRSVRSLLSAKFGFVVVGHDGSHTIMVNARGHRIRPKFVNRQMHIRTLQSLRRQLDANGLDGRAFWKAVRTTA